MADRRARRLVALAAALLVAACSAPATGPTGSASPTGTSAPTPAATASACVATPCTASVDGAQLEVVVPARWNGTLLLYSHGYRSAQPTPPDLRPVSTSPEPAPGWSSGDRTVGDALLARGYAIAGSSYASNGWAVADGVRAGEDVYAWVRDHVGRPDRVYAWGDSLGGLVTTVLAERHPDWVTGSAPLCGALAGTVPNMDLALDVGYAVRELIWPQMTVRGFTSYQDAVDTFRGAASRVLAAARDVRGGGAAAVLFVDAVVDGPTRTRTYDGATPASAVAAAAEGVLTALSFETFARYDLEQRLGGDPSTNVGTDYAARISAADRQRVDALDPGATTRLLAALARGRRVAADPAARAAALRLDDPQGRLSRPMLTLHTRDDPLVLVQNESWYAARVAAHGAPGDLEQLVTVPPATYPEKPGAPYGAGHCAFTPVSRIGVVDLLDRWVRTSVRPTAAAATAALGAGSGVEPAVVPPPWPLGGAQP